MEIFLKYKIVILRVLGALMLLIGFASYFWATPKEGFTQSELAAANVARMEAKVKGGSSQSATATKKDDTKFLRELKNKQERQIRYLTIIAMILGVGFLGYSFIKKKEPVV